MTISFVSHASYTYTGTPDTDIRTRIPEGVEVGDLIVCAFGNIGNSVVGSTMNNGWTKIEEAAYGTNCYFLMAAKVATPDDVAGSEVSIATKDDDHGQAVRSSLAMAYRGAKGVVASAMVHESGPDQQISAGPLSSTSRTQWFVCFFNMAGPADLTTQTWDPVNARRRETVKVSDGIATSSCAGYDRGGHISAGQWSCGASWPAATRLNAGIMLIESIRGGA